DSRAGSAAFRCRFSAVPPDVRGPGGARDDGRRYRPRTVIAAAAEHGWRGCPVRPRAPAGGPAPGPDAPGPRPAGRAAPGDIGPPGPAADDRRPGGAARGAGRPEARGRSGRGDLPKSPHWRWAIHEHLDAPTDHRGSAMVARPGPYPDRCEDQ